MPSKAKSEGPKANQNRLVGLPTGSSNSTDSGRTNMAAFLTLGDACPIGYEPGNRNYFPHLPDAPGIQFVVLRTQDMAPLATSGKIDGFIAFGDVVAEAQEAGVCGIEKVINLPFAKIDVVMVARQQAPYSTLEGLLSSVREPICCVSELPFLARKSFFEENIYQQRFGGRPPSVERYRKKIVDGSDGVRIIESAGSSEPQVEAAFYHCGVVIRSTGRTIAQCHLKVTKVIGTFHPGLFRRAGMQDDPALGWFADRLKLAQTKWAQMQRCHQLELAFLDA